MRRNGRHPNLPEMVESPNRRGGEGPQGLPMLPLSMASPLQVTADRLDPAVPISQAQARAWFDQASISGEELSGVFGVVRRARVWLGDGQVVDLAIKRQPIDLVSDAGSLRTAFNEYYVHMEAYLQMSDRCREHYVQPYAMQLPSIETRTPDGEFVPLERFRFGDDSRHNPMIRFASEREVVDSLYTVQEWAGRAGEQVIQLSSLLESQVAFLNTNLVAFATWVGTALGTALECLRRSGFVHNDVHSENVLLCYSSIEQLMSTGGRVVLVDLGMARGIPVDMRRSLRPEIKERFGVDALMAFDRAIRTTTGAWEQNPF